MKSYEEIINRMAEIIKKSEMKKAQFSAEELKEKYSEHFAKVMKRDIDINYALEMSELIDLERTVYIYTNSENSFVNNNNLISIATNYINGNNTDRDLLSNYKLLLDILKESSEKSPFELIEYCGFMIAKNRFNEFKEFYRNPQEAVYLYGLPMGKDYVVRNREHKKRMENILLEIESNNLVQQPEIKPLEQLNERKMDIKFLDNIDELIQILISNGNINAENLKYLIPAIGINNYNYLIEQLFKKYVISALEFAELTVPLNNSELNYESYEDIVELLYAKNIIGSKEYFEEIYPNQKK